jgi:hypothetical protein
METNAPASLRTMAGVSLGIFLAALVLYVGGYFLASEHSTFPNCLLFSYWECRYFSHQWLATIYEPAAWLESRIRGCSVSVMGPIDDSLRSPGFPVPSDVTATMETTRRD